MLKLNLFLLAPIVVWIALCGGPLADWISKGKYSETGPLLLGFTGLLVLQCHYRKLELQAQAVEKNALLMACNLFVATSLVPAALLAATIGPWGIVIGVMAGCLCRDTVLTYKLTVSGTPAAPDWAGLVKLFLAAAIPWLVLSPLAGGHASPVAVILLGMGATVLFLATAIVIRPFTARERDALNGLIGRRLFLW